MTLALLLALTLGAADQLTPGNHTRTLEMDGQTRSYLVHVPPKYDPQKPTPVVLAFHGGLANAGMMVVLSGLSNKADEAGFIVVYPNGTGFADILLGWNAGRAEGANQQPDDVAFVARLLDDLGTVANVDAKRVYATGMSNGGMMCYRLAAELSDRIAAIAPVSGTMGIEPVHPRRPVPIIHFHGTADTIVPFDGPAEGTPKFLAFKPVGETISTWVRLDGCPEAPVVADEPDKADDGTKVQRRTYGPGKDGAEVVLFVIQGGGHTWPGRDAAPDFLGKSTKDISANDVIWKFFENHPMK